MAPCIVFVIITLWNYFVYKIVVVVVVVIVVIVVVLVVVVECAFILTVLYSCV